MKGDPWIDFVSGKRLPAIYEEDGTLRFQDGSSLPPGHRPSPAGRELDRLCRYCSEPATRRIPIIFSRQPRTGDVDGPMFSAPTSVGVTRAEVINSCAGSACLDAACRDRCITPQLAADLLVMPDLVIEPKPGVGRGDE